MPQHAASSPEAPPLRCGVCGGTDLDEWLGICMQCLGRAGRAAVSQEEAAREPERVIDGHRLVRLIGRGGMGSVHEAVREADGLRVALKLIQPEMAADPKFRSQFERESEALRVLDHPGVVRRLHAGEEQGVPYLVMEFVDGPDLRQVLRRGPMAVERALAIAVETCQALAAAHAAGIVHRDIKPANILLDPDGRVKVADFGMARSHAADHAVTDPATLLAAAGHHTAPELERKGAGDARADIYSVGALLYHLLTGNAPRANFQPARRERPGAGISAGVDRIIHRALQTNPARRFPSMQAMAQALEQERARVAAPARGVLFCSAGVGVLCLAGILGWFQLHKPVPSSVTEDPLRLVTPRLAPLPPNWDPERRTNSLGMPFVSIPVCAVMFCAWETRVSDYTAFAEPWPDADTPWVKASGFAFPLKKPVFSLRRGEFKAAGNTWKSPGFPSAPDHAACGVSGSDAKAFCTWLTWKERQEGIIRADQAYRLPTDAEWSAAAGLKEEPGQTPEERVRSWPKDVFVHPWSPAWPAPDEIYNVAGDEVDDWPEWHVGWQHKPRRDPWRGTAPVAAVPACPRGLFHLTGNVMEWTESSYNTTKEKHALVLRGGSWMDASREGLSLAFRDRDQEAMRMTTRGFRIVFVPSGAAGWRYVEKP